MPGCGMHSEPKATFTLFRFHFYPFLLMKTLPVHIAPFSNRYAMKTIGVHIALAEKTKPFVNSFQQGANRDFECHCNQKSINKGMCRVFKCLRFWRSH